MKNNFDVGDIVEFVLKKGGKIHKGTGQILKVKTSWFWETEYLIETDVTYSYLMKYQETRTECFEIVESDVIKKIEVIKNGL